MKSDTALLHDVAEDSDCTIEDVEKGRLFSGHDRSLAAVDP